MKHLLFLTLLFSSSLLFAQEKSMKERAIQEFEKEHYNEAINILEKALSQSPNDPEIYYYLGFFNHYRASDSRPLAGHDFSYSKKIFEYLDKAIKLDPGNGDAKYFYGAECCANAFISTAIQLENDLVKN
jgi:tetratricopeptide (TPR) repeat protein